MSSLVDQIRASADPLWIRGNESASALFLEQEEPGFASNVVFGSSSDEVGNLLATRTEGGRRYRWTTLVYAGEELLQLAVSERAEKPEDSVIFSASARNFASHLSRFQRLIGDATESTEPIPSATNEKLDAPIAGQLIVARPGEFKVFNPAVEREETTVFHVDGTAALVVPTRGLSSILAKFAFEPEGATTGGFQRGDTLMTAISSAVEAGGTCLAVSWDIAGGHAGGLIVKWTDDARLFLLSGEGPSAPGKLVDAQVSIPDLSDPAAFWALNMSPSQFEIR